MIYFCLCQVLLENYIIPAQRAVWGIFIFPQTRCKTLMRILENFSKKMLYNEIEFVHAILNCKIIILSKSPASFCLQTLLAITVSKTKQLTSSCLFLQGLCSGSKVVRNFIIKAETKIIWKLVQDCSNNLQIMSTYKESQTPSQNCLTSSTLEFMWIENPIFKCKPV